MSESSDTESAGESESAESTPNKPSNGSGNGTHARRFDAGWNRLLDPHKVNDKNFVLPGWDGLPFRGSSIPFVKEDDPPHRQPQISYEPHIWILDLSIKEDLDDYRAVYQLVANGVAVISAEERQYDKDSKNWRIFLRWALVFTYMPMEYRPQA